MLKTFVFFILLLSVFLNFVLPVFAQTAPPAGPCFTSIAGGRVKVPCGIGAPDNPSGAQTFGQLVTSILNIALAIVGSVAVAFLIYGGFRYITAYGNEEHTESAKKIIRQAILGLIVVVLAFAIINIVVNVLILGRPGAF